MIRTIDAAVSAGADAVKLQCFTPEQMAEPGVNIETGPWAGRELLNLYRETHTPRAWFAGLFEYCAARNTLIFASVFHQDDVDFLETLACPIYKIASFEITDVPLIYYAASTGKPMIVSTGMATFEEIEAAVTAAQSGGCTDLTLLKCTSSYPAPIEDCNLATFPSLQHDITDAIDVGLSDHTMGHAAAVAGVALGATVIEKHLILSRQDGGPDAAFSAEPAEFAAMVKACREAAQAIGTLHYGPTPSEVTSLQFRRQPGGKRGRQ